MPIILIWDQLEKIFCCRNMPFCGRATFSPWGPWSP